MTSDGLLLPLQSFRSFWVEWSAPLPTGLNSFSHLLYIQSNAFHSAPQVKVSSLVLFLFILPPRGICEYNALSPSGIHLLKLVCYIMIFSTMTFSMRIMTQSCIFQPSSSSLKIMSPFFYSLNPSWPCHPKWQNFRGVLAHLFLFLILQVIMFQLYNYCLTWYLLSDKGWHSQAQSGRRPEACKPGPG